MIAYEPSQESFLCAWWASLGEDRDRTFHSSLHRLGAFLDYFNRQAALVFEFDEKGIWFAGWTRPLWDGAECGLWVRPDKRRSRAEWKAVQAAYGLFLDTYPALIGFTKQAELHSVHLKLGYRYAGSIKGMMDGGDIWAYELTREGWKNRVATARSIRLERKAKRAEEAPAPEPVQRMLDLNGSGAEPEL